MKRMLKKPAFMLFLLILPLMSFLVDRLGQGESEGMSVGLVLEADEQGGTGDERMRQEFLSVLREQEGVLRFRFYEDEEKMRQDVEKGELDCGVCLREDLWDGLGTGAWQETITIYATSSSSMTDIVKEKIASVVFTLYSKKNYVNYVTQSEVFAAAEETSARTDIVSFAKAAYETHLLDGSTFAFQYRGDSENNSLMPGELPERTSTFRLRGILAVCIFLSGLCGLLTDWKDREEKRFVQFAPPVLTTMVNVWIPTLYTSVIALFSLLLTGQTVFSGDSGRMAGLLTGLGKEIGALVFYQFLIVLYCSIIRVVLKKQEMIAAAIPLLTLASIVCCPVWIRLAVYLPFFRVLEKFFPVTYYLLI